MVLPTPGIPVLDTATDSQIEAHMGALKASSTQAHALLTKLHIEPWPPKVPSAKPRKRTSAKGSTNSNQSTKCYIKIPTGANLEQEANVSKELDGSRKEFRTTAEEEMGYSRADPVQQSLLGTPVNRIAFSAAARIVIALAGVLMLLVWYFILGSFFKLGPCCMEHHCWGRFTGLRLLHPRKQPMQCKRDLLMNYALLLT